MNVRMLVCMSGPKGVRKPGDVVDLAPEIAQAWIEAKVAAPVAEEAERAVETPPDALPKPARQRKQKS